MSKVHPPELKKHSREQSRAARVLPIILQALKNDSDVYQKGSLMKERDYALIHMICKDLQPISVVSD